MAKPKFNFTPAQFPVDNGINEEPAQEAKEVTPASILEPKKSKTEGFQIKIIPRKKIRTNKKNCYGIREVERLKESILQFGLQQNLTVVYSLEEDMYIIEAGHRRCQALDELIEEFSGVLSTPENEVQVQPLYLNEENSSGKPSLPEQENTSGKPGLPEQHQYTSGETVSPERIALYLKNVKPYEVGYPCKINSFLKDEEDYDGVETEATLLSEARLIITNEDVRSTNPAEKAAAVARLEEIYQKLNIGKKKNEKINVMEKVAEDMNISKQQVANYKSFNNLLPELKEEFERNNITLKEGSEIGKLNEDEQRQILAALHAGEKVSLDEIKALKKEKANMAKDIKEKEALISKLQIEVEETSKQLESTLAKESKETIPEVKEQKPSEEEIRLKEDLHRKEEEIKLLMKQVEELKNKPTTIIDTGATNLYRAELAAKTAHENLLKAQADFLANYVQYEKLLEASPIDTDRTLLEQMRPEYIKNS